MTELVTAGGHAAVATLRPRPGPVALWFAALRAYSFPASIVPCLVGAGYLVAVGAPVRWAFLPFVLVAAVAVHCFTNLVNDAVDFERGVDSPEAQGGSGVITSGWATPRQFWIASFVALAVALVVALPLFAARGWPLVLVAVAGAAGGYAYTGPPFSLKYHALGEPWVFVFMGTLMVVGTVLALAGGLPPGTVAASLPVGCMVAAILSANNIRDHEDDAAHGVRTISTILGPGVGRAYPLLLIAGAYVSPPILAILGVIPFAGVAPLLTLPLGLGAVRGVLATGPGRPRVPGVVERVAALHMIFGLAYAAGLVLGRWVG